MTLLKLRQYEDVVSDCQESLRLLSQNMKAYYYMAEAQLELGQKAEGLKSALAAYELCSTISDRGWAKSLPNVVALVLRAKKESWEVKENARLGGRARLLKEVLRGLSKLRDEEITDVEALRTDNEIGETESSEQIEEANQQYEKNVIAAKQVWDKAALGEKSEKRREVPDWAIDNITFAVMHDPVMVGLTCNTFPFLLSTLSCHDIPFYSY